MAPSRRRWSDLAERPITLLAIGLAGVLAIGLLLLFWVSANQTEDELNETEQQASQSVHTIQQLCQGARGRNVARILRETGACAESQDVKRTINDPDPDDPEIQQGEVQNPERQQPEIQNPEKQEPEIQDPEKLNEETQEPEVQNPEEQDPEVQNPEKQDPEVDDPEPNDDRCGDGYHPETRQVDHDHNPDTPPQTWQVCAQNEEDTTNG